MAIYCQNLSKNFTHIKKEPGIKGSIKSFFKRKSDLKPAVREFSAEIESGEIVGLLGPNGAGKTTIMKMCTGIICPSAGTVRVLNEDPFDRTINFRMNISLVMGQKTQLWWDIPAMDSFLLLKSYYEIPEDKFKTRLDELASLLNVTQLLTVPTKRLSLGERMKMELIACLLHHPKVLFLDEPTIGLDIVAQQTIRNFIKDYHQKYKPTIVLTSHYMADVAALCPRIILVLEGRKRFDGSIKKFEQILGAEKLLTVSFAKAVVATDPIWGDLSPTWGTDNLSVELRVKEELLREKIKSICEKFSVIDIRSEQLPIERVMNALFTKPGLLP